MAVRERTRDREGVGGGDEGFALEAAAEEIDDVGRQVGEVAEGLMLNFPVLTEGASEVVARIGDPLDGVGDFGDMYSSVFASHAGQYHDGVRSASTTIRKDFGYKNGSK